MEALLKETRVLEKGSLIVFHEKIRTNGLGVIKMGKDLSEELYKA